MLNSSDSIASKLYSGNDGMLLPASPEQILSWSHGEVTRSGILRHRSSKPEQDGLFCTKIFGSTAQAGNRSARFGHIRLGSPCAHPLFLRGNGSTSCLSSLLGLPVNDLERLAYYETYIVITSGAEASVHSGQLISEAQYEDIRLRHPDSIRASTGAEAIRDLLQRLDLRMLENELQCAINQRSAVDFPMPAVGNGTTRDDTLGRIGPEDDLSSIEERLRVVQWILMSRTEPCWTILEVVPVIPPACRPMIELVHGELLSTWPNDLYSKIINRNNRLRKLIELNAPNNIIRNEKRALQRVVDLLFRETMAGVKEGEPLFELMPQLPRYVDSTTKLGRDSEPFPFDSLIYRTLEDELPAIFENLFIRYRELCEVGAGFIDWNSIGNVSLRKLRMLCLSDGALERREHRCLESGSRVKDSVASQLSDCHSRINARDSEGRTVLMQVVTRSFRLEDLILESDKNHLVEPLLDGGENIDAQSFNGATALVTALRSLLTDAAGILLKRGANPNLKSLDGYSALLTASSMFGEHAVAQYYFEILKELIDHGGDVNAQNIYGQTALLLVSKSNVRTRGIVQAIVEKLLDAGASPRLADNRGITPLMVAASKPHTLVVRRLLECGAGVSARDQKGRTALMRAARTGNTETLRDLLAYGAEINTKTNSGRTALMIAAESGRAEAVELLLSSGADAGAMDEKKNTALTLAAAKKGFAVTMSWDKLEARNRREEREGGYSRILHLLESTHAQE